MKSVPAASDNKMSGTNTLVKTLFFLLIFFLLASHALSEAAVPGTPISRDDPEEMLRQATGQLLDEAGVARAEAKHDSEAYYAKVTGILNQVMDTQYFARGVMATYGSTRLYKSLNTDTERAAFQDRVRRFSLALERVWMVKYAKVLLQYGAESVELTRIKSAADHADSAVVRQTIRADDKQVYVVQYSLRKGDDDRWLVSNVIVEGINLGLTYRSQFAAAVEKHKGNVDYAVDSWADEMDKEDGTGATSGSGDPS